MAAETEAAVMVSVAMGTAVPVAEAAVATADVAAVDVAAVDVAVVDVAVAIHRIQRAFRQSPQLWQQLLRLLTPICSLLILV